MKLIDIQNTITKKLHNAFPTYKIVLDQQKEVTQPTFFVNVRKLDTSNNRTYKNKIVAITITYVNKTYNPIENNEVNDLLDNMLNVSLRINDRYVVINNLNFSENEALICSFTVEYNEKIEEPKAPIIEEIESVIR